VMVIEEIPEWVIVTAAGIIVSAAVWLRRQATGLGAVRLQADVERDRVIELMKERLDLLEARVLHLETENARLLEENESLRSRARGDSDGC